MNDSLRAVPISAQKTFLEWIMGIRFSWAYLIFFAISTRLLVSLLNCYQTQPFAAADAKRFHLHAVQYASNASYNFNIPPDYLYENFLGFIYYVSNNSSLFWGQLLTICGFCFSCAVLIKITKFLNFNEMSCKLVFSLFSFSPVAIIYTSITMREGFMVLFFISMILSAFIYYERRNIYAFICFFVFSCLFGALHHGLSLYAILFFTCAMLYIVVEQSLRKFKSVKKLSIINPKNTDVIVPGVRTVYGLLCVVGIVLIIFLVHVTNLKQSTAVQSTAVQSKSNNTPATIKALLNFDMLKFVIKFRGYFHDGRTDYKINENYSNLFNTTITFAKIYFFYHFKPFVWDIQNFSDFIVYLESWSRIILIILSIKLYLNSDQDRKKYYRILLLVYFSLAFMWALGTANFGTAMRHHLITNWIIVVMGGHQLCLLLQKFHIKHAKHTMKI